MVAIFEFLKTRMNIRIITYVLLGLSLFVLSYYFSDQVLNDQNIFNSLSYYGNVTTAMGLLIAVAEVLHSVRLSRSIQDEAKDIFDKAKRIESASTISDCLAAVDDVSNLVSNEDYRSAIRAFQYLRKICAKSIPKVAEFRDNEEELTVFGRVELLLQKATHTTPRSPLTKKQKTDLLTDMLNVKQKIEELNPARDWQNATNKN